MDHYRFGGENTLTELVRNVYQVDPNGPTLASIGKKLVQANPQLDFKGRTLSRRIPIGTMIVTPEVEGAHLMAAVSAVRQDAVDALPTEKSAMLVRAAIVAITTAEEERLQTSISAVKDALSETDEENERSTLQLFVAVLEDQIRADAEGLDRALVTVDAAVGALRRQQDLLDAADLRP